MINAVKLICPEADSFTCDVCDLQEVEQLASLFLDKFCAASVAKHPRMSTIAKVVQLKNEFISTLGIVNMNTVGTAAQQQQQQNAGEWSTYSSNGAYAAAALHEHTPSVPYSLPYLTSKLDSFIAISKIGLMTRASSILSHKTDSEQLIERTAEIVQYHFTQDERFELARLLIRKLDKENQFHCDVKNCQGNCGLHSVIGNDDADTVAAAASGNSFTIDDDAADPDDEGEGEGEDANIPVAVTSLGKPRTNVAGADEGSGSDARADKGVASHGEGEEYPGEDSSPDAGFVSVCPFTPELCPNSGCGVVYSR